jgi:3D (Asp-Asp-Asp) domain-containing protein
MSFQRSLLVAAMALGVGAGSYGIASAASGSSTGSSTTAAPSQSAPATPWGHQRSDETPLTGDALAKVTAVAESKVPGGTVVRVETDADGHAKYEAHMTDANGNSVTVYVDADFNYVSTEQRP